MAPEPMGVDPDQLIGNASRMASAAGDIPPPPPPFSVTGSDALSMAINAAAAALEGPIQTGLPVLKAAATKTATDMVAAGKTYQQVDDDMARQIQDRIAVPAEARGGSAGVAQPGGAGGAGAGVVDGVGTVDGVGVGGGTGQLNQLMAVPIQALGALGSLPQAVAQGAQQGSQVAGGGAGRTPANGSDDDGPRRAEAAREAEETRQSDEKRAGAAPAHTGGVRAPVEPVPAEPSAPVPRHLPPAGPAAPGSPSDL